MVRFQGLLPRKNSDTTNRLGSERLQWSPDGSPWLWSLVSFGQLLYSSGVLLISGLVHYAAARRRQSGRNQDLGILAQGFGKAGKPASTKDRQKARRAF